jgi:hypothetical protein
MAAGDQTPWTDRGRFGTSRQGPADHAAHRCALTFDAGGVPLQCICRPAEEFDWLVTRRERDPDTTALVQGDTDGAVDRLSHESMVPDASQSALGQSLRRYVSDGPPGSGLLARCTVATIGGAQTLPLPRGSGW